MKTNKVQTNDTNGFTTTEKFQVLMCSNVEGNNNKFYCIELQKNPTNGYRLFTHYGRLGLTNVFEVRLSEAGQPVTFEEAEKEYLSIIKKKLSGKKKEGYRENYEIVDVVVPTVGSDNIKSKATATITTTSSISTIKSEYLDPDVSKLINQICEENIHNITSVMDVKLSNNGFETALGPVTDNQVEKARKPLDDLKGIFETVSNSPYMNISVSNYNDNIKKLNTYFYSLIPHKFGSKITEDDLINSIDKVDEKFGLLDMLASAVQMGSSLNQGATSRYKALGTDIELLKDNSEIQRIASYIYNSKADNHRGSNIWNIKVKNIYKVLLPEERRAFETYHQPIGNVKELFHGSRNCNILSILKGGLIIVRSGQTKTGEMFGPGIYFADNSTKSANYSNGFWGGIRNKYNNNFLFLADIALGKIKEEYYSKRYTQPPQGFHSVKGVKGNSLYNNEYIVYDKKQVTLKYLVEFHL